MQNGELVEVEGRPMIVYYDPDAPDWFVDESGRAPKIGTGQGSVPKGLGAASAAPAPATPSAATVSAAHTELREAIGKALPIRDRVEAKRKFDALVAENERLRAKLAEYDKYVAEFTNNA